MQNLAVQAKSQKRAFRRKEFKMPSGTIRHVQGYEPFALTELLKLYTEEQIITECAQIPHIQYTANGKKRYYFPDIYIPHLKKIIEVKSTYTYKCTTDNVALKASATRAAGYDYEVWVYNQKGIRVEI